jgi:hypothetical protein
VFVLVIGRRVNPGSRPDKLAKNPETTSEETPCDASQSGLMSPQWSQPSFSVNSATNFAGKQQKVGLAGLEPAT